MARKVELPVTGAANGRARAAKKPKGKSKARAPKMPTIGDDGGSPMFRLFLWVAVIASLAYAATRVEWRGKTVAEQAGEFVHWDDAKAKAVALAGDARVAIEQWTKSKSPEAPAEKAVVAKKASEPKPKAAPKSTASVEKQAASAEKPGASAVEPRPDTAKSKAAPKSTASVEKQAASAEKPGASAVEPRPIAPKAIANNRPHEELGAEDRAALDRLMGR